MSLLSPEIAKRAIYSARPSIRELMDNGTAKRQQLHIIVAHNTPNSPDYTILAEQSIGDTELWEHRYDEIAKGKTAISARTGLSSREVQTMHPSLLEKDDVMFWGNAVIDDIIVSCSGVQPWLDEAISLMIAGFCRAFIQDDLENLKVSAQGETYNS